MIYKIGLAITITFLVLGSLGVYNYVGVRPVEQAIDLQYAQDIELLISEIERCEAKLKK